MSTPSRVPKNYLTQTSDPAGPSLIAGDAYYNSTAKAIRVYDGAAWVDFINDETAQTIAGVKTFSAVPVFPSGSYATVTELLPVSAAAEDAGTSPTLARGDHKHDTNTATAIALTGAAAQGSGSSLARADHQHGNTVTGGWVVNTTNLTGNAQIAMTGTGASSVGGTFSATQYTATGQTGAATSTKYAGGTASGSPASGTFAVGDWIVTTGGDIWICTGAGTPGTWVRVGSYLLGTANTWTSSNVFNGAITGNNTINLSGTGSSGVGGTFSATAHATTGITGAVSATRYAGGTASVAPTTGTFIAGDYVITLDGKIFICTTGGSPGTWTQVGSSGTPASSVTTLDALQSAVVGTGTNYARDDHKHAITNLVTTNSTQTLALSTGTKTMTFAGGEFVKFGDGAGVATLEVNNGGGAGTSYSFMDSTALSLRAGNATVSFQSNDSGTLNLKSTRWTGSASADEQFNLRTVRGSSTASDFWFQVSNGGTLVFKIDPTGNSSSATLAATGITGATSASRYVGATTSGAPASGTFVIGDFVIARNGKVWVCTTAGSPGTWTDVGGGGSSPLTTKGDLFTYDTANQRLAVGANGTILMADSAAGTGLKWVTMVERIDAGIRGEVAVQTGKHRYYLQGGGSYTLESCIISVSTAPTGATLIVDVNLNGTTIYTTQSNRPAIAISGFSATGNTANVTTYASGDYFTFDVDQIGSTIPGSDLMVTLRLRRTA